MRTVIELYKPQNVLPTARIWRTSLLYQPVTGEILATARRQQGYYRKADVNRDGVVNILDLTLVAQALGTGSPPEDVNGDGVVNVFDLVFVAGQF